jgi:hypothetical protein
MGKRLLLGFSLIFAELFSYLIRVSFVHLTRLIYVTCFVGLRSD